jgi:very-short-patch-repair endonuclease
LSAIVRARALGIAEHQLGVLTQAQLERCGLSESQVRQLVSEGFLVRMHRGVYRAGGPTADVNQQSALAACLACGDEAVASHRTAAFLRRLVDAYDGPVEVIVPRSRRARRPGIHAYRRELVDNERTHLGVVPMTTVERTLFDLSGCIDGLKLEEAADRAFRTHATTPERLERYLPVRGESRAAGVAVLRSIVDDRLGRGVPESVLESKTLALLRRFRLPDPVRQYTVSVSGRTIRFDLAYPDERVAIELDGRAPHWGRERWQSEHHRDNAIELGGWQKIGFTWWDVTRDEIYVATTVARTLGLRPASWRRASAP